MNFIEELKWRGMIHDIMPGTEEELAKGMTSAYIGFDPTSDSLHIGSLVQIMTLVHFQRCGHKPVALVGGATGMVGDPSGKSQERNLLSIELLNHNLSCMQRQLERFLDFNCGANSAEIVNNFDWFKNFTFLDFIRDVGKHITVNYMMAKDSVQKRLESGMSFTEFSYQLVQGFDFYWLYKNKGCKIQMGGSDQWGNIVTGTELIRRKEAGEAYAITTPLIKKADGTKFGKTEEGNVWLDSQKTSAYKFFQYWINTADEDALNYIKIFTLLNKDEVDKLIEEHQAAPHLRILQNRIAKEVTTMVHSTEDYEAALEASQILFGKGTFESLSKMTEEMFLSVFEGVPVFNIDKEIIKSGINIIDLLSVNTNVFPSKGEARKTIAGGGVSVNKNKVEIEYNVSLSDLISEKYILIQKGKKNYYLVKID
ncbi:MAG: tyrosine--tRNA ligase [Bacteroidetes bacterium GWA2_31_9]|nr:MAG: tyrosine--tRNA ligase [Bacteroidetes bacterium GWA2_31_9]